MEWEKMFANDMTDKGLISKIYKQLIEHNIKKQKTQQTTIASVYDIDESKNNYPEFQKSDTIPFILNSIKQNLIHIIRKQINCCLENRQEVVANMNYKMAEYALGLMDWFVILIMVTASWS